MTTMNSKSIGLSGLPGAGKNTIGNMLAKELGWRFYSFGEHLRNEHKKEIQKGETQLPFEQWWYQSPQVLKRSNESFRQLLTEGNIIGDSRYIVANVKGLKIPTIYLYAPLEVRASRILERGDYNGLSLPEIKEKLSLRESDEIKIGHTLFDSSEGSFDYTKAEYTLRIDTSLYSPKEVADQILKIIKEGKF